MIILISLFMNINYFQLVEMMCDDKLDGNGVGVGGGRHSGHSSIASILEESSMLGQGAFGVVQKVFHFKSWQIVAIKVSRTKNECICT